MIPDVEMDDLEEVCYSWEQASNSFDRLMEKVG